MAIPGASDGQEVIRRGTIHAQDHDWTSFDFTGGLSTKGDETDTVATNHIITVLSISWCEQGNAAELIKMSFEGPSGTPYIQVLNNQPLAAYGTYIWNEKIVLIGGDQLTTHLGGTGNCDIYCTYLDQDWS